MGHKTKLGNVNAASSAVSLAKKNDELAAETECGGNGQNLEKCCCTCCRSDKKGKQRAHLDCDRLFAVMCANMTDAVKAAHTWDESADFMGC